MHKNWDFQNNTQNIFFPKNSLFSFLLGKDEQWSYCYRGWAITSLPVRTQTLIPLGMKTCKLQWALKMGRMRNLNIIQGVEWNECLVLIQVHGGKYWTIILLNNTKIVWIFHNKLYIWYSMGIRKQHFGAVCLGSYLCSKCKSWNCSTLQLLLFLHWKKKKYLLKNIYHFTRKVNWINMYKYLELYLT